MGKWVQGVFIFLAAMLTLQTAMFASFGNELEMEKRQMMNMMTGTVDGKEIPVTTREFNILYKLL